ncbi:Protein of unknown function [Gryllus bimaculatus]|nr:Protein of unknown function [Gryllus bimaculatus]
MAGDGAAHLDEKKFLLAVERGDVASTRRSPRWTPSAHFFPRTEFAARCEERRVEARAAHAKDAEHACGGGTRARARAAVTRSSLTPSSLRFSSARLQALPTLRGRGSRFGSFKPSGLILNLVRSNTQPSIHPELFGRLITDDTSRGFHKTPDHPHSPTVAPSDYAPFNTTKPGMRGKK